MPIPYRFINTTGSNANDKADHRKAVRSYVARVAAEPFKAKGPRPKGKRKRKYVVFDVNVSGLNSGHDWHVDPVKQEQKSLPRQPAPQEPEHDYQNHTCSVQFGIGPNSVLPCSKTAVFQKPYMAAILTNYVDNLVVRIPELDEHSPLPLLRTIWLPHILNTPVLFEVIALNAAIYYATHLSPNSFNALSVELIWIKQRALTGLVQYLVQAQSPSSATSNSSIINPPSSFFTATNDSTSSHTLPSTNPQPQITDDIIAATAKMASYEAAYGSPLAYHTHMAGVAHMVRLRGGLSTLGLNGFLARLLLFIDSNSAMIMHEHGRLHLMDVGGVMLPRRNTFVIPNPLKYLAFCGGGSVEAVERAEMVERAVAVGAAGAGAVGGPPSAAGLGMA